MPSESVPSGVLEEWNRELAALLDIFPPRIAEAVRRAVPNQLDLVDVTVLAGRRPMLTVAGRDAYLPLDVPPTTQEEVDAVVSHLGHFDHNARAAMPGLLHRISAHVGADDHTIYAVTARVGRAIPGVAEDLRDLLTQPLPSGHRRSILIAGPAGVGKSTLERDVSRLLSELYRVILVDKSGELGGDSHVPHHTLGDLVIRLECDEPEDQYKMMKRGLQNLTAQVIMVDEIGNADEVYAARDISNSSVQLIATTHAQSMERLIENTRTAGLLGADPKSGYKDVTFGDDNMARLGKQGRRRVENPVFDTVIFMPDRNTYLVYDNLTAVVDKYLMVPRDQGIDLSTVLRPTQTRVRGAAIVGARLPVGATAPAVVAGAGDDGKVLRPSSWDRPSDRRGRDTRQRGSDRQRQGGEVAAHGGAARGREIRTGHVDNVKPPIQVMLFGVSETMLREAARHLDLPVTVTGDISAANAVICLSARQSQRGSPVKDARREGIPVQMIGSNRQASIESALRSLYHLGGRALAQ